MSLWPEILAWKKRIGRDSPLDEKQKGSTWCLKTYNSEDNLGAL